MLLGLFGFLFRQRRVCNFPYWSSFVDLFFSKVPIDEASMNDLSVNLIVELFNTGQAFI